MLAEELAALIARGNAVSAAERLCRLAVHARPAVVAIIALQLGTMFHETGPAGGHGPNDFIATLDGLDHDLVNVWGDEV